MDKSYKQRTLDACRELIEKYENYNAGKKYFNTDHCPLCQIYYGKLVTHRCPGCILSNSVGQIVGCNRFKSNKRAQDAYENYYGDTTSLNPEYNPFQQLTAAFQARADFFKKIIPILELEPEENFEPENKHYFINLDRSW
jgi:hypothetical protein